MTAGIDDARGLHAATSPIAIVPTGCGDRASSDADITGRKGGKGGGGSSFKESANNLRSKSTARIVGIVSAGPIKGLVNGEESIYFDNTPLKNGDGTYNHTGVTWDMRLGYPDQEHLPGFAAIERERSVGQQLKYNAPIVRTIDDPSVNGVRIKLGLDALSYLYEKKNHLQGTSVSFAVDVASGASGPYVETLTWTISGKTTSAYQEARRVDLPRGGAPWRIRLRRLTRDSNSSTLQNSSSWVSYTEIIDSKLTYPDTAVIGLKVDAQQFGDNLQKPAVEVYGRLVKVPSNYDPETRTYEGFWDGTFKLRWTDNPAWIFYDLLTDVDIGLGQQIAPEYVDVWSIYTIGKYCDELVDDGFGGKEPRFTFNCAIMDQKSAYETLTMLAGVFRGMMYWGPGTVMLTQDAPAEPERHLTPANLITESADDPAINYEGTAFSARHSVALVTWANPAENYSATIEVYEDPDLIAEIGWKSTDVVQTGCVSQGQAARAARYIVDTETHATQTANFRQALEGADLAPGAVVYLSDPAYAGARTGGRLVTVDASGCTMDAPFRFVESETYRLFLTMPDGTGLTVPVINPRAETATLEFAAPLSTVPPSGTVFAILASNLEPQQYRIVACEETDKHIYAFTGLAHDPTKYVRIEQGLQLERPNYSLLPSGPIEPPTGLTVLEQLYLSGGITPRSMAVFSWTASPDPRVIRYGAQAMRPGTDYWFPLGETHAVSMDVLDTDPGYWRFAVRAFDGLGRYSQWAYIDANLMGLYEPPPDVHPFRIDIIGGDAMLSWGRVDVLDLSHYELRYSPDVGGVEWKNAMVLSERVPGNLTSFVTPGRSGTYLIKAVDIVGVYSVNAALIVSNAAVFDETNVVEVLMEDPDFAGPKTNIGISADPVGIALQAEDSDFFDVADFFDTADFFLRSGLHREGVYDFAAGVFDLQASYPCRLSAHVRVTAVTLDNDFFAGRPDFFDVPDFFNVVDFGYDAWVELRHTADDPASDDAVWTDWERLGIGEYLARAFEFRCILTTEHYSTTPVVTELSVEIDMPDRIAADNDLAVPETGLCVDYNPPFLVEPSLGLSCQDMRSGDYYEFDRKDRTGFCLTFYDATNAPVTRSLDYIAKGYGYAR